ncbi:hypothetical protein ZIOFF_007379 [Zingiber officinale]|uniref:Uncharacterized protein n=2 Tax=Zingiber officinale TaxID=94328 RepID=A0A8J5LSY1_ZINOF|nr:hypothetical protein ZIOFF_007379 [Zingiber officinale]
MKMPRNSRHRSHRSRKRSRGCSDSEEEESLRERRTREEETTGGRVSRDLMPEKQRSSHEHVGKEMVSSSNGDVSSEKKRKTRGDEEVVVADRWNGGMENDGKKLKSEDFGPMEPDKSSKAKTNDTKNRSSRRDDGSNERNEDRGGRNDSMKGKSEKDSNQRERSYHYKDGKERVNNKDREVQDSRHEKSEDQYNRKNGAKTLSNNEEYCLKKNAKINATESQVQDLLAGAETEKGSQKHTRRDDNEDKDKRLEDSRDADGRRLSSRDHSRSRSHKDERHENTKYKGKYKNENDRDQNHHDDKNQDERLSKDRSSDKSDRFHLRDENKSLDGYRKIKLQDTNQDDTYVDARDTKLKDRRRRYSNDDPGDSKLRGTKLQQEAEKNASSASRTTYNDKPRSVYRTEKSESSPKNKQFKGFASSINHTGNDINRNMRYEDSGHRVLSPEERRPNTIAKGDSMTSSGFRDRNTVPRSGKLTTKDDIHSGELLVETVASSKYDRASRSDDCSSPNQSKGRSSTKSSHRIYERSPSKYERAYRQSLDTEIIQRNASYNEGDRGVYDSEKPIPDDMSQAIGSARETTPLGSSSIYRSSNISDRSPNHLRPPSSSRVGIDSPSVLGPYQEDNKAHSNDRRSYGRYKRTSELGFERGHGNARKGAPNWSAPATNVFMPLQHGPPPGFHPAMSHFPPPPLFGVRPMDLAHGGVSYHMHEMAERFSGHGRPFGWHNSVEQLCHPQMQMWDRTNGIFGNETHIYGRQEWDENGQLMGSRGWEMGSEMWKDHNVNDMDSALRKEQSSTQSLTDELVQSKCLPTESIGGKQSSDTTTSKNDMESPHKAVTKKTFKFSHMLENKVNYVANYLSRIDISSDLAGLELYERCTSEAGVLNTKNICSLTNSGCFQMKKDDKIEKMDTRSILKSFYATAKDDVFKKAMSLYRKQTTRYVKPVATETVCSEETKISVSAASENEVVQDGCHSASLEKPRPFPDDPAEDDLQVENDLESDHVVSDVVSCAVAHDAVESIANLTRIPNSDENTH